MNKQALILTILGITGALLPVAASADDNNSYAAVDAGPAIFSGQSAQDIESIINGGNGNVPLNSSFTNSTGYRFTYGYQINSNWGIEVSYVDLGESDFTISQSGSGGAGYQSITGDTRARGWGLSGVGTYPIDDQWSLFARVGAIDARVSLSNDTNTSLGTLTLSNTSTDWRAMFGAGISWSFAEDWTARLGWDQYHQLGDSSFTSQVTVNFISVGIGYSFPLSY
ncbi:MAG: outer membrane protein [Gammaproteobacteria bacterium]